MNSKALEEVAARVRALITEDPSMKEANVKLRLIQPLLAALEWDTASKEVELEYPVRVGSRTASVDIALKLDGKPVVFIETKAFDSALDREDAEQAISYGRYDGVRWCVLTSGRVLRIYDSTEGKDPGDCLVAEVDLGALPTQTDDIRLLSRSSLLSQETESAVRLRKSLRAVSDRLDSQRSSVVAAVAEVLRREVPQIEQEQARGLAEVAVSGMREEIARARASKTVPSPSSNVRREERTARAAASDSPAISRRDLNARPDAIVLVCPAKVDPGVPFFLKYEAWGYIRTNQKFDHLALYVTSPESKVLYIGDVETISPPLSTKADLKGIDEADRENFTPGKRVVWLKKGSIRRLMDPIPAGRVGSQPQSPRSTTVGSLQSAKDTGDLW